MENNQLYHHGTKGMKWGRRLYQNKDGSLTPLGRLRYGGKSDGSGDSKGGGKSGADNKSAKGGSSSSTKKSVKDMTDEELARGIERMRLEKAYMERYNELNPKKVSAGEKIFRNVIEPVATQAAKNLFSDVVNTYGKKILGIKDDNSLDALKKEVDRLDLVKRYKDHGLDDLQREASRLKAEASIRTNKDRLNDKKNDSESKSEPELKPEPEPTIKVEAEFKDKPSTKTGKKGEKWVKKEPIFVDDFKDVSTTDIAVGRNYFTNNILSLPAPRDDD